MSLVQEKFLMINIVLRIDRYLSDIDLYLNTIVIIKEINFLKLNYQKNLSKNTSFPNTFSLILRLYPGFLYNRWFLHLYPPPYV